LLLATNQKVDNVALQIIAHFVSRRAGSLAPFVLAIESQVSPGALVYTSTAGKGPARLTKEIGAAVTDCRTVAPRKRAERVKVVNVFMLFE
jgi:hypothetical protein